MLDRIEFVKELGEKRRDIFIELQKTKFELDKLLEKKFFRQLLEFYQWMESLDGLSHWMYLHGSYLLQEEDSEDCDDCLSGKMKLVENLIFQLKETEVLDKIKTLNQAVEDYEELSSYKD